MIRVKKTPHHKTVLDHLLTQVPTVSPATTVGQTITLIRSKKNWETINYIYVLDQSRQLIGVLSIKELLRSSDSSTVEKLMVREPAGITASASQEHASILAIKHSIKATPIFKPGTREFLGVVGNDKILDILHDEHVEDFLRFSGIVKEHPMVNIFKAPVNRLVKARIPWLFIGLLGGMVGAAMVAQFEVTLKKEIALAFFIPIIVYISNAVSTQTQAILLRLLVSQKIKLSVFLRRELLVSVFLAAFSALAVALFAFVWLGSSAVAITVGSAIFLGTLTAVLIAILIPIGLFTLKKDPALGSGPFATALQDVSSLLIYFLIARLIIF